MAHPELARTAACVFDAYGTLFDVTAAEGAAAFGMKTVWANRGGLKRPRLPAGPVAEIQTLDALPGLLGL
jgi:FMN phosphatase YigB (HAD superfamily)